MTQHSYHVPWLKKFDGLTLHARLQYSFLPVAQHLVHLGPWSAVFFNVHTIHLEYVSSNRLTST